MHRFLIVLLTCCTIAGLSLSDNVEAKRFGGGKSLGKQYSTPSAPPARRPATAARDAGAQPTAAAGARASGASRWLGPLAGLAAGGLLASLFLGDAFEGMQILDLLLILALVIGGLFLFRALRRRAATVPAGAPAAGGGYAAPPPLAVTGESGAAYPAAAGANAPAWFDGVSFIDGAKTHFIRLQAAWDQADFSDIRDYTSPQLFAELKRERDSQGNAPTFTEVVTLDAELLGARRDDDQVVVDVRFSGLIREQASGTANRFDEIWHVQHDWRQALGDWLIVGIQQQSVRT